MIITFLYRHIRWQTEEQPSTVDHEQVTNDQDVPTDPSEPITSSNQQTSSSLVLTDLCDSDMMGYFHTFSGDH